MNNLERRITALEQRLSPRYITLVMADGRKHRIRGDGRHLVALIRDACEQRYLRSVGESVPVSKYESELSLIAASVGDDEAGALVQLCRLAMRSPVGDIAANRLAQGGDLDDGEHDYA